MTDRLTPERAAEITELRYENERLQNIALPELRRGLEAQREAKKRWRDRAEKAEAEVAQWRATFDADAPPDALARLKKAEAERDQARRDAELQRAAYFHEAARLLEDTGRDDDAVNLLDNVANGIRANVDAIEAARNAIRRSYTGLIAQAEQDRDPEGAFALQAQLRDREAQWKRDDEGGAR